MQTMVGIEPITKLKLVHLTLVIPTPLHTKLTNNNHPGGRMQPIIHHEYSQLISS